MSLADHIQINIQVSSVGPVAAGFGIPLILSPNASFSDRIRFYGSTLDVAADFSVTSSPEYLAAAAMFAQPVAPQQIAVGRAANKPTQTYVISIVAVRNSSPYHVQVDGEGVTSTETAATSGGSATNDSIVDLIVTALNAVAGKNYTAAATGSGGSHVCTVTGDAAGNWFSLEVLDNTALKISQTHTDPGVAADMDAIRLVDDSWYGIHSTYNSKAVVTALAAWTESNGKLYSPAVNETDAITTTAGNADTLDALHTSAYARTNGWYHPSPKAMLGAAVLGHMLPIDPGSDDWKWQTLAGVPAVKLTATHRTNLLARKANSYQVNAGLPITWEGTCSDGTFVDIIRGRDWLQNDMSVGVYGAIYRSNAAGRKVPFTDAGFAIVEAEVRGSLKRAAAAGIIRDDFVVTMPRLVDVSGANKTIRKLAGIKFSANLAGAVHDVAITGSVSAA